MRTPMVMDEQTGRLDRSRLPFKMRAGRAEYLDRQCNQCDYWCPKTKKHKYKLCFCRRYPNARANDQACPEGVFERFKGELKQEKQNGPDTDDN